MIKKTLFAALSIMLFAMTCKSQGLYSKQNLEKASEVDFSIYLAKAQKQKKTGRIITIAGPSTMIAGVILMSRESTFPIGFPISIIGLGGTMIGIPIFVTGSSRVKKVSKVWNTKFNTVWIDLAPGSIYNYQTRNIQPGISLIIRF